MRRLVSVSQTRGRTAGKGVSSALSPIISRQSVTAFAAESGVGLFIDDALEERPVCANLM
jgi:hypothetical protein